MGYDRRWLDAPHVGDHVGRSIWALGEILSTAWVPAVVGPTRRLLDTIVGTLGPDTSLRTGAYAVLGLARLDPDRLQPEALRLLERCRRAARRRVRDARVRRLALVRGRAHLRQRAPPARADRRRRRARPRRADRDGPRRAPLARRRVGPRRRHAAADRPPGPRSAPSRHREAATSSRSTRRRSSRRSSPPSPSPAIRSTRRARSGRSTGSSAATGCSGRCTTSPPVAAATGSATRRRTTTRVPSRRSPSTARRCCSTRPACPPSSAHARETVAGVSDTRALQPPPGQPDPDGGGLAVSRQRRLQPGRRAARRHDRPARARRGPAGISHLTVARSSNGDRRLDVDPEPLLAPDDGVESEQWGFEDARVVFVPELERWVITCTAYGPAGPAVFLATTEDFATVERHGIVRQPEDKNAALLPHRVDGKWILFHRPEDRVRRPRPTARSCSRAPPTSSAGARPSRCCSRATGAWWDASRIGIGPPLLRTEHGWLLIYHGVKETVAGSVYRVGLALLDLEEPTRVLHRLPTGSSRRSPRTSVSATCRTSSSRAGSCTTRRATRSGCTTAPPTRRSASRRRDSAICSKPCSAPRPSRLARPDSIRARASVLLRGRPLLDAALLQRLLGRLLVGLLRLLLTLHRLDS